MPWDCVGTTQELMELKVPVNKSWLKERCLLAAEAAVCRGSAVGSFRKLCLRTGQHVPPGRELYK